MNGKKNAKTMRSEIYDEILKETSLEIRLKVLNEMAFINLLSELGYREDKMWTDEEDELLDKLCRLAYKHTQHQLEEIIKWQVDGCPE